MVQNSIVRIEASLTEIIEPIRVLSEKGGSMSEQISLEDIHSVFFKFKYGDPNLPCKVPGSVYLARRAKLPQHDIVRCDQILAALKGLGFLLGSAHINQYKNE